MTDKRSVVFEDKREKVFTGTGQVLGGDSRPSRLVPSNMNQGEKNKIRIQYMQQKESKQTSTSPPDVMTESEIPGKPSHPSFFDYYNSMTCNFLAFARGPQLSADQFLGRLPRKVVSQGRVIDIRESVGKVLKVCSSFERVSCVL